MKKEVLYGKEITFNFLKKGPPMKMNDGAFKDSVNANQGSRIWDFVAHIRCWNCATPIKGSRYFYLFVRAYIIS